MRVVELWRYPVKSLQGERVDTAEVTADGLEGDRRYVLVDTATGLGLTARRAPELLFASARLRGDGSVVLTLPDGSTAEGDRSLSAWLGRPVQLRSTTEQETRRYEDVVDPGAEATSAWQVFEGSRRAFHDSADASVSLVSQGTLGAWERRRFRANVVLDGDGEDELVGTRVHLGAAVLDVRERIGRCVVTTRPQPGGVERDPQVLRTVHRERGGRLAVGALVARPGPVRVGDALAPA